MRCSCCNRELSDYEATLKHGLTGKFLDTCVECLSEIALDVPMPVKASKNPIDFVDIEEPLDKDDEVCYPTYKSYKNIEDSNDLEDY